MSFSVTQKVEDQKILLEVKGGVDEDAVFTAPNLAPGSTVVLDLEGVTAINSVGIREWIKWIKAFPMVTHLSVRHCPKVIVDQINMVAGFLPPNTVVQSFFVPYYSDATGSEKMVLFQHGREYVPGKVTPPENVKDETGAEMEMDVIEAKYFKFLNG